MSKIQSNLYLIPNLIGDTTPEMVIPPSISSLVKTIKHFIVEDIRTTRRYLRKLDKEIDIDSITFYELNKHTDEKEIFEYLKACELGYDIGLISDAGLPCVADPGNVIVKLAHLKGIRVVPLSGPSSILMALMASGLNGQNFAFNGYVPIESRSRVKKLLEMENRSKTEFQSQIFMDTPYRNNKLLDDIIVHLNSSTTLCIASNITCNDEFIKTMSIKEWKKNKPDLNKKPCIFII